MITYHGTSLSAARKLLQKKFQLDEAKVHASIKKYDDSNELWAIVEIETNDNANIYTSLFTNSDNGYRYDIYQQNKPDIIKISLDTWFDIDIIYNMNKITNCKIVEII
jgi:hypothetical protein